MNYTVENGIYDDGTQSLRFDLIKMVDYMNKSSRKFKVYLDTDLYCYLSENNCSRKTFIRLWQTELSSANVFENEV